MLRGLEDKLLKRYKNIKRKLISINWDMSWDSEEKVLRDLSLERSKRDVRTIYDSLYQFKAQTFFLNKTEFITYQLMSVGIFCYLIFSKFLFSKKPKFENKADVAFFFRHNIYSDNVKRGKSAVFMSESEGFLEIDDIKYLFGLLWIFKFNFGVVSTATYRVAQIKYAKKKYDISEIWSSMEYSCACGIAYDYVCRHNITISNFMHGEKVLTLRDSFCVFHKFYVWEDYYADLFRKLLCKADFIIDRPWITSHTKKAEGHSILYFLKGIEDDRELELMNKMFKSLQSLGYQIFVKDHPRQPIVSHYLENCDVIPREIEFFDIVDKYDFISAQYSTVLNQAYFMGKLILIDDYTNQKLAEKLKERCYYFYNNEFNIQKISQLLK